MSKKQHRKKEELEKMLVLKYPHFKLLNNTLAFLFLLGLALTVWEINLYENTFIPLIIPLSVWIVTGVAVTPFLKKLLSIYFLTPYLIFQVLYNICAFGGIAVFIFIAVNYYCAHTQTFQVSANIISTGHLAEGEMGTCEQPYIVISYQNKEKEVIFLCNDNVTIYKKVDLTIAEGLFGFDIIKQAKLNGVEGTF